MSIERGPDRRQQPRRHEDALVHYAEQNLLAAALAYSGPASSARSLRELEDAAASYRFALARAEAERRVRNP